MVSRAIDALYQVQLGGVEVLSYYQPWNILLAIKWALQEADSLSHRRPRAEVDDFHVVLNVLREIDGHLRMPTQYEHVSLFMRHLAFQQFWLQRGASAEAFVRQDLLFSNLPPDHFLSREFQRLTGLCAAHFIELSFALLAMLLRTPTPRLIRRESFSMLEPTLVPGALDGFFLRLGKSIQELHAWLVGDPFRGMSVADQKILPSPLLDVPLIRTASGTYNVIFPALLMRSLESIVYRTLRCANPAEFGSRFGPIFEKYVGNCLSDAGITYVDESGLKAQLSDTDKCVDFLVVENHTPVLIDAKGVEMSPRGRVSQRADLVFSAIKESAIKGIVQGMATARRIIDLQSSSGIPPSSGVPFLIVVTFDDLFLGSNSEFGTIFGRHLLGRLEREFGVPLPIPLEHVFFLTIDEFEGLLASVHEKRGTIAGILADARARDADPHTRKFVFQQHLDLLDTREKRLPMVNAGLGALCRRCIVRLPQELRE
jgi:hypothetical protein